jgi:hypothetical protein
MPAGMELFATSNLSQWEYIQNRINECDYYVLIVANRYGSIDNSTQDEISFTEQEYNYAINSMIPIMTFVIHNEAPIFSGKMEQNPDKLQKLNEFKKKVTTGRLCKFYKNPDELKSQFKTALKESIYDFPRDGWIKSSNSVLSVETMDEFARLSKENLELKTKIFQFEKENNRNVILELLAQQDTPIELKFLDNINSEYFMEVPEKLTKNNLLVEFEEYIKVQDKKQPNGMFANLMNHLEKIEVKMSRDDLVQYFDQNLIDEYNLQLPVQDDIDKYNQSIKKFERIKNAVNLPLILKNIGNLKATTIIIKIKSSSALMLLEKIDYKTYEPDYLDEVVENTPNFPNKQEFIKEIIAKKNKFNVMSATSLFSESDHYHTIHNLDVIPSFKKYMEEKKEVNFIDEHNIEIKLKTLIHTDEEIFNNISIVVLERGKFVLETSIICEELSEPINNQIKIYSI